MRRLAAEAVAIFFGVAAALAGQAWFEHRADLRAEREFLVTVEEELEVVDAFLVGQDAFLRGRGDALSRIFVLTSSPSAPVDTLVAAARTLARIATATSLEPLDDVLAPDRLTVVRDADLRRRLARFRSQVGVMRFGHEQNVDFVLSELRGLLHEHFGFCSDGLPPEELLLQLPCRTPAAVDPRLFPQLESYGHLLVVQYANILRYRAAADEGLGELRAAITARLAAL